MQGLSKFFAYPLLYQERVKLRSSNFVRSYAHLQTQSEQKPIKNFGKSSRGRTHGLRGKIFRAPIHRAHRTVIFAIAQLSCLA